MGKGLWGPKGQETEYGTFRMMGEVGRARTSRAGTACPVLGLPTASPNPEAPHVLLRHVRSFNDSLGELGKKSH